jgi:xanthine dehydrogenase accessory factor
VQRDLAEALLALLQQGGRGALATVVRVAGSAPQVAGARMLLRPDGSVIGTVGGGAIEHEVLAALERCRTRGEGELLVRELGHDLGMCCGGRMELFIEPIEGAPRLHLCGAGHIAHALAPLVRAIGFELSVVDEREELNTEQRFAGARRELCDPETYLRRRATLGGADWLLIATHDHALDERLLELALGTAARYIGLVGSRRKLLRLLERIRARRGELALERLYAPVGLALNAQGPAEIAVSIAAELVALRRGASVPHLRALDDARLHKVLSLAVKRP